MWVFFIVLVLGCAAQAKAQIVAHYGSQTVIDPDLSNLGAELEGVAVDSSGNVYVVDIFKQSLYKETLSGGVYTRSVIASGFDFPYGVAVDTSGNVYVADQYGVVYKETVSGGSYVQSVIDTPGGGPIGVAVDASGNVFVVTYDGGIVYKETPSGGGYLRSTVIDTGLNFPTGISVDANDNLYIANQGGFSAASEVSVETLSGGTYTMTQSITEGTGTDDNAVSVWVDATGNLFVAGTTDNSSNENVGVHVYRNTPSGGKYFITQVGAGMNGPSDATTDSSGNIYITVLSNFSHTQGALLKISQPILDFGTVNLATTSPTISVSFTFDSDGPAEASVAPPLTDGSAGGDYADAGTGTCDTNGTGYSYKAGDTCTVDLTFTPKAVGTRNGSVQLLNGYGNVAATAYVTGVGAGPQLGYLPGDSNTVSTTGLGSAAAVAVDGNGDVFIADSGNDRVLEETYSAGSYAQSLVATTGGTSVNGPAGIAIDLSGTVYYSDPSNNEVIQETYEAYDTIGAYLAATVGSGFNLPKGLATDSLGNLYVADSGNDRIVEESFIGGLGTYGQFVPFVLPFTGLSGPSAVGVDGSGNLYIADTGNGRVLKETASGNTYAQSVLATGLNAPAGVAVDPLGNVYISDTGNNQVLKETLSGSTYTQSTLVSNLNGPAGLSVDRVGNLYIANAGASSVVEVLLGSAPTLTFAPTPAGTTSSDSPQTVTLINVGSSALSFPVPTSGTNPSISGNFSYISNGSTECPDLLSGLSTSPESIAPNGTCTLAVSFTPAATGTLNGSLVLTDNDAGIASAMQTIGLNGTGTGGLTLTPATYNFGDQPENTTSAAEVFTLSNTGATAIDFSIYFPYSASGGFSETDNCGGSLAAGSSCSISVTFSPNITGSFANTLSVSLGSVILTSTLTGTGTAVQLPVATLTPAMYSFGNQTENATSAAEVFTLSNTGNAALTISGVTLGGANPASFAQTNTCGTSVAAGSSCSISITFTPGSASSLGSTLSVADNAAGSPQTAVLTGTGTAPPSPVATLTPATYSFGNVTEGATSAASIFTLANTGNAALTISGVTLGGANPASFAQTNTCGTSVAAGSSCSISITFTPGSASSLGSTLSVADNAAGSPQTAVLTGTGSEADFSIASPTPVQTVQPGGAATYSIVVTPQNGSFTSPVSFSASGLPAGATASFSPATVTPGSSPATTAMTIQTAAQSASIHTGARPWSLALPAFALAGIFWMPRRPRRRWPAIVVLLFASVSAVAALTGCAGGFQLPGSASAKYTIVVTATSGSDQQTTTVQLTVQ